ncbi:MAG: hypothetical protein ACFFAN_01700 [Promethearchaeota archaeon]
MKYFFDNIFEKFGEINFGEINNLCIYDFERYFKKYFSERKPFYSKYYELNGFNNNNNMSIDFEESFLEYFSIK